MRKLWFYLMVLVVACVAQNPPVPLAQNALGTRAQYLNASSTGTSVNTLTSVTGAPSKAVITSAAATGGVIGITVAGQGTTGSATVQTSGNPSCVFDGATTAGNYVQISASVAGKCTDAGSSYPSTGQVIGRVLSTNAAGGTFVIDLFPSEIKASAGAIGPTGPICGSSGQAIFNVSAACAGIASLVVTNPASTTETLTINNTIASGITKLVVTAGASQSANRYLDLNGAFEGIDLGGGASFGDAARTIALMNNVGFLAGSAKPLAWSSTTSAYGTMDTGVSRSAAGVVCAGNGTGANCSGTYKASTYQTATNCSSSASPAVCSSASAGSVVVAAAATTVVVNTTAVTANSQVVVTYDSSLGTKLGVTCNTTIPALYGVTARTAATSFTITSTAPVTNPACFSYLVVN